LKRGLHRTQDQTQAVRRGERREAIVAAAVEEFARWGYDGASTNRIAQTAQVAKGLIFRHFGSKEGLFSAALETACERLFPLEDEPLPADPFARLEEFLARRMARIAAYRVEAWFVARFRGHLRSALTPPARRIDEYYARLRSRLREGLDTGGLRSGVDPQAAAELLVLVAEGFERRELDLLAAAAAGGEAQSVVDGFTPEAMRNRVRTVTRLLRHGIYRPGARTSAQPVCIDTEPFLAALGRLAPVGGPADERRERILHAAQHLFAERGYEGTSAEAIAARAGVAKGLVFHYFGSKADLYLAAVADAAARLSAVFFAREDGPQPDLFQRLMNWTRRKALIFQEHPTLYGLVLTAFAQPPGAVQEAVRQYVTESARRGWELIMDGVDTTPFRPDIAPAQAVELVMMVTDTLADRLLVRLGSRPDKGLNLLPVITEQTAVYLALLRDGLAETCEPQPLRE